MPTLGRLFTLKSGDSMELLETAEMSGGERTRARFVLRDGGLKVQSHMHPKQDETYEVISGCLTYVLGRDKRRAVAGETVTLPRGVPHQHHCEGPGEAVVIQTVSPGLDFDYLLESIFGLGSEGRAVTGFDNVVQGLVWIRGMRSTLLISAAPPWVQHALAWAVAPLARLFGYRAVHRRFSGVDW